MGILTADCLYAGQGRLIAPAWLQFNTKGILQAWGEGKPNAPADRHLQGLVFGGLVNAHCHLELSHLKGKIPEGTGMAGFVRTLQPIRAKFSEEEIMAAANEAAQRMWSLGIAAVGDICNGTASKQAKDSMPEMVFHNFIEVFGLDAARSDTLVSNAIDLAEVMGPRSSITLHAPYSISIALRNQVQAYAQAREWPQSIHLLESIEERQLFESLDGPLMEMLRDFGAPFPGHASASSVAYVLPTQPANCPTLLVHVTQITAQEIELAKETLGPNAYFVLCPQANQYIHGTLPPVLLLVQANAQICIGTDSLAGNHDLDIWAEMRLLQAAFGISTATLLQWAIDNGCKALGLDASTFLPTPGHAFRMFQMPEFLAEGQSIPSKYNITKINP